MNELTFNKENNELFKFILNNRFLYPWKYDQKDDEGYNLIKSTGLELIITPDCNQNCSYCYLQQHKDKLYPVPHDNKTLLSNLDIILNWIIEEQFQLYNLDLFSGEIWHTNFGLEILNHILQACKDGAKIDSIMIASNGSFVRDHDQTLKIQNIINEFKKINIRLMFSFSVDGKTIDEKTRPNNDKQIIPTDEFYDNLFAFAKNNDYKFHPMIAPESVKYWIENLNWWDSMCDKYGYSILNDVMMLEVRDDRWTDENINDYIKLCDAFLQKILNKYNNNIELITETLLELPTKYKKIEHTCASPGKIGKYASYAACNASNFLIVRLGDLAICPCHRTSYNKYIIGNFIVDNNKIVDVSVKNFYIGIYNWLANRRSCSFNCDTCIYSTYCPKGCFGSQLETNADPYMPCESVCKLYKSKIHHLLTRYEQLGMIEYLINIMDTSDLKPEIIEFLELFKKDMEIQKTNE